MAELEVVNQTLKNSIDKSMDSESVSIRSLQREMDKIQFENKSQRDKANELNNTIEMLNSRVIAYERELSVNQDQVYKKERQIKEESNKNELLQLRIEEIQLFNNNEIQQLQVQLNLEKKKYMDMVRKHQLDMENFRIEVEENLPRIVQSTNKSIENEIQAKYEKEKFMNKTVYLNELESLRKEILHSRTLLAEKENTIKLNATEFSVEIENLKLQVNFLGQRKDQLELENKRLLHLLNINQQQQQQSQQQYQQYMPPQQYAHPPPLNQSNYGAPAAASSPYARADYSANSDDYMKPFYPPPPPQQQQQQQQQRYSSPAHTPYLSENGLQYLQRDLNASAMDHTMALVQSKIHSMNSQLYSSLHGSKVNNSPSDGQQQQRRQQRSFSLTSASRDISPIVGSSSYSINQINNESKYMSPLNYSQQQQSYGSAGSNDYLHHAMTQQQQRVRVQSQQQHGLPSQVRQDMRERRIQEAMETFDDDIAATATTATADAAVDTRRTADASAVAAASRINTTATTATNTDDAFDGGATQQSLNNSQQQQQQQRFDRSHQPMNMNMATDGGEGERDHSQVTSRLLLSATSPATADYAYLNNIDRRNSSSRNQPYNVNSEFEPVYDGGFHKGLWRAKYAR